MIGPAKTVCSASDHPDFLLVPGALTAGGFSCTPRLCRHPYANISSAWRISSAMASLWGQTVSARDSPPRSAVAASPPAVRRRSPGRVRFAIVPVIHRAAHDSFTGTAPPRRPDKGGRSRRSSGLGLLGKLADGLEILPGQLTWFLAAATLANGIVRLGTSTQRLAIGGFPRRL